MVDRRDPAGAQHARDLGEVSGLVAGRDVHEDVERPDGVHAPVGDARDRGAVGQDVLDVARVAQPLGHEVERALGDVDEHEALRPRREQDAPAPAARPDLDDGAAGGDGGEEDLVDERLLPLLRGRPLLAHPRPVPAVPPPPVLVGGVVAPRAVGGAVDPAGALDVEHRVLHALPDAPGGAQRDVGRDVARAELAHAADERRDEGRGLHDPRR